MPTMSKNKASGNAYLESNENVYCSSGLLVLACMCRMGYREASTGEEGVTK